MQGLFDDFTPRAVWLEYGARKRLLVEGVVQPGDYERLLLALVDELRPRCGARPVERRAAVRADARRREVGWAMMDEAKPYRMRAPCLGCGALDGRIERKANNDVVRCARCDRFAYCAPRSETGLPVDAPKPLKLSSKFDGRCTGCGVWYRVGDSIWWTRGVHGACCETCGAPQ